ncbi:hypothetical protein, partial [Streptomyces sp. GbtcB7]
LRTSGDRGEHRLIVGPSGEIDVEVDDRTVTRAELRQQAWWTTDPEPVHEAEADEDDASAPEAEPEVDGAEPALVAEVPAFFPPSSNPLP